jgi:hypothetical protein
MKVVVTSGTLDLIAAVGIVFALCALCFVVYWEVERRRQRKSQIRRAIASGRGKQKYGKARRERKSR